MGHALKDGRGDLAPTTYLLFKEIVYLIVGLLYYKQGYLVLKIIS